MTGATETVRKQFVSPVTSSRSQFGETLLEFRDLAGMVEGADAGASHSETNRFNDSAFAIFSGLGQT